MRLRQSAVLNHSDVRENGADFQFDFDLCAHAQSPGE